MFDIVFYKPEIPPNTGNAMRLAAVTGCRLHLIEPLGFDMDDAKLRRAGMDYRDKMTFRVHQDIDGWRHQARGRIWALAVDGVRLYTEVEYQPGDALLFGPESVGLPDEVKTAEWVAGTVRLPMLPDVRSINLSNSAAIVVYEAWRQQSFNGSRVPGDDSLQPR